MLDDIKKTLWATADKLRNTLLPCLISGQLRLSEQEITLEVAPV